MTLTDDLHTDLQRELQELSPLMMEASRYLRLSNSSVQMDKSSLREQCQKYGHVLVSTHMNSSFQIRAVWYW